MNTLIVIPASVHSQRLPKKPLIDINGMTLLERVWLNAKEYPGAFDMTVATSDFEVVNLCQKIGLGCDITGLGHLSGSTRVAEVFRKKDRRYDVVLDVQCDEPFVDPNALYMMAEAAYRTGDIFTLAAPLPEGAAADPNEVKVIVSDNKACHWFSRANMAGAKYHVGVYAFSKPALATIPLLDRSKYAIAENLEQLTWVEAGMDIGAIEIDEAPLSINTIKDLEEARALCHREE